MLGFDTENKVKIVITYGVIPALIIAQIMLTTDVQVSLAQAWLVVTFAVVFGRVALLWYRYGFMVSMHWFVKFITDPFSTFVIVLLAWCMCSCDEPSLTIFVPRPPRSRRARVLEVGLPGVQPEAGAGRAGGELPEPLQRARGLRQAHNALRGAGCARQARVKRARGEKPHLPAIARRRPSPRHAAYKTIRNYN